MGASSVTGVGQGAAYSNKGNRNGRDCYVPLASPHVVTAGMATTSSGGTVTVTFPTALTGSHATYAVVVTAATGTTSCSVAKTNDGDGNFSYFVITGAVSTAHNYVVVTAGVPFVG